MRRLSGGVLAAVQESPVHELSTLGRSIDVSVILSTYNRAGVLPAALDALLHQTGDVAYEVILVDNNSTDGTADLGRRYAEDHPDRFRYVFEAQQGLSHGRNAGIRAARGSIVAFTDDDVQVAPDWVAQVKRGFDGDPAAAYVGGRILPRWTSPPPRWLTTAHWSPLALQDYGDAPVRTSASWPICLVGGNLSFRRSVFDQVGLFTPSLGRIRDGIGSTEDHEMQLRLWMAGLEGVYLPAVTAVAEIPSDRMTRAYHVRWQKGHGRHCARMRLRELVPREWAPMGRPDDLVTLWGVPAFMYAELPKMAVLWLEAIVRRRDAFFYGNKIRHLCSYIAESWRRDRAQKSQSAVAELARFTRAYARKTRRRVARPATR
jgi:glycosyltransferase involved in cell wall biosynthesis